MDWLPKPKVEAEGFENNILSFAETETKNGNIEFKYGFSTARLEAEIYFLVIRKFFSSLNDKDYLLSVPADKSGNGKCV